MNYLQEMFSDLYKRLNEEDKEFVDAHTASDVCSLNGEHEDEICQCLAINYILANYDIESLDGEKVIDLIYDKISAKYVNRLDDIEDIIRNNV